MLFMRFRRLSLRLCVLAASVLLLFGVVFVFLKINYGEKIVEVYQAPEGSSTQTSTSTGRT